VVTFSILWFFSRFLKPYKLESLGAILVIAAAGSMVGWPLYRLGESLHKRGRLPDMQRHRVAWTVTIIVVVLLGFFLVPLPVGRIRQTALVQCQPDDIESVYLEVQVPCILDELNVRDGQRVEPGEILARFSSLDLETKLEEARSQQQIRIVLIDSLNKQSAQTTDANKRHELETNIAGARGERAVYEQQVEEYEKMLGHLVIRAPRGGVIMSPPKKDEVGKQWEKDVTTPFCSIGDPTRLRALMPVPPSDYNLLAEDLRHDPDLDITLRIQGRDSHTWKGKVSLLPQSPATKVPFALTNKGGGPLAVKPSTQPNTYEPQSQQYLVGIDILDPDGAICPGNMAQVKIHCRWHSAAWWVWRTINSTFDLGLM
jgi:putative peptide zinc metalloprotease protein